MQKSNIIIFGRGDLHLGILLERMRREGFEMALNPPQVIFKEEKGVKLEPIEEISVELGSELANDIIEQINSRKGTLVSQNELNKERVRIIFDAPSRGLFGFRPFLIALTKGNVIINSKLKGYDKYRGLIKRNTKGAIIACAAGKASSYALKDCEVHGQLYIEPGSEVYAGMVVGELIREGEVEVNPCREKHTTNVRAAGKDEFYRLSPSKNFSIEEAMVLLRNDELLEVTPKNLRIRKKVLDTSVRRRNFKNSKKEDEVFDY